MPASAARNFSLRVAIQGRALAELGFWIANLRTVAPQPCSPTRGGRTA